MDNNSRILIIDDDESTCRMMALIFGQHGYEIETAGSGREAIEKAQARPFNLALLDLQLPDTEGGALLTPLKETYANIGLIVITGHASLDTAIQALNHGASAYIIKPLNIDEVLAKVRDVLEKQRLVEDKGQAEERLRRRNRELALLNRVITAATSTLDVDQVLQVACQGLAQAFDLPRAAALLLNADGSTGTFVYEHLAPGCAGCLGETISIADNPMLSNLLHHSIPVAEPDTRPDEQFAKSSCSLLLVPIPVARGRVAGALALQAPRRRVFSADESTLAQNVAAAAGQALETARLYHALQRNVEKLEETVAQRTAELQVALERARDADRVKSEFVSNVSHELRTPLASLKLFLGLLTRGRPEKRETYLGTLRRETERLQDLIEALLDISRLDLGKTQAHLQPTDLNLLVGTLTTDRGALAADRGLIVDVELANNLPLARADSKLIEQVLTNLLTNAINYTPVGGQITLYTSVTKAEGDQWVTISVSDTGPGIPEMEKAHLFERFYRGSAGRASDAPGTGLGLAICRDIMALHAGRVTLENSPVKPNETTSISTEPGCQPDDHTRDGTPEQGSTFVIWLPVANE